MVDQTEEVNNKKTPTLVRGFFILFTTHISLLFLNKKTNEIMCNN